MSQDTVDLFGGIGWGFACRELGIDEHGIDIEPTVFKTREALGWESTCADILDLDPTDWAGVDGLIASPPCQSWSRAGKGAGLDDARGQLVWQPLVWALATRPRWIACEQVPEARGAFDQVAYRLREVGYHTDVYTISSETFGVPQTRLRVFLVAHRDRAPRRPEQTHQRYRKGRPRVEPVDMLGLLPWVSMAEALDFGFTERPALTVNADSVAHGRSPIDGGTHSRKLFAEAVADGRWLNTRTGYDGVTMVRGFNEPAPTLTSVAGGKGQWLDELDGWPFSRPSTTVCTNQHTSSNDGLCERPTTNPSPTVTSRSDNWTIRGTDKPVALTEPQGCRLMGFPDGTHHHLAGNKQDRWRIIGNAVCPPVGKAVLSTLLECAA